MARYITMTCASVEGDPAEADSFTVECAKCDPDNPTSVPREECPACRGTGRSHVAFSTIVSEIRSSRLQLLRGGRSESYEKHF